MNKINLKSTVYGVNPMIPQKEDRPRCTTKGCTADRAITGTNKDGSPKYRKVCAQHHEKQIADSYGVKYKIEVTALKAGFKSVLEYQNSQAAKKGFDDHADLLNSKHPYRKHRKDYCENKDGRLGYRCNFKIRISAQLQTDHKNGDPTDNRPRNLQTLCCNCHTYKTHMNKDYKTAGRKKLGVKY